MKNVMIVVDPKKFNYDGKRPITVAIDPADYGLIHRDKAVDYVDIDEFLNQYDGIYLLEHVNKQTILDYLDDEDMVEYLDKRTMLDSFDDDELIEEIYERGKDPDEFDDPLQEVFDNQPSKARLKLCDLLRISHLSSNEQIYEELKKHI